MPTSGAAAYQQLTKIDDGIGQAMQFWGGQMAQQNEANNKRREAARITKDKERKKQRAANEGRIKKVNDKLVERDTGMHGTNGVRTQSVSILKEQITPIAETLMNPNATEQEKVKARMDLDNINNQIDNVDAFSKTREEAWGTYQKGVASGTIHQDDKYEGRMNSFLGGDSKVSLTEDGQLMFSTRDLDGDGEYDAENISGAYDGHTIPNFHNKVDLNAAITEIGERNAVQEEIVDENHTKTTTRSVDEKGIMKDVKGLMFGNDGALTNEGWSLLRQMDVMDDKGNGIDLSDDDFSDVEKNFIISHVADEVRRTKNLADDRETDQKAIDDRNNKYANTQIKKDAEKRKGKGAKDEEEKTLTDMQLKTDEKGKAIKPVGAGDEYTFSFGKTASFKDSDGKTTQVKSANVDAKGGVELIIEEQIEVPILEDGEPTGKFKTKTKPRVVNDEYELGEVVRKLKNPKTREPYKNLKEFKDHQEELIQENRPEQGKSKTKTYKGLDDNLNPIYE